MKELKVSPGWKTDNSGFTDYDWDIVIDKSIVGEGPDGANDIACTMHYSLFCPQAKNGEKYPVIVVPGGVGDKANRMASTYSKPAWQEYCPCYVMHCGVPYEGIFNFESQMYCMSQFAEIIRNFAEIYGNVDLDRVYSTGGSQGAIWSYMLEGSSPGFYAGLFINAGTAVHTTWADRQKMEHLMRVPLLIVHGTWDTAIPINEAYRVYNKLKSMGKKNMAFVSFDVGHIVHKSSSTNGTPTPMMKWLFAQSKTKGDFEGKEYLADFVDVSGEGPWLFEAFSGKDGDYSDVLWAGIDALSEIPGWNTELPYSTWIEGRENSTWDKVKAMGKPLAGTGGSGKYVVGKFRIADEGTTSYDKVATTFIRPINEEGAPGDMPGMPPMGGPGGMQGMPPMGGPDGGEMPPPPDGEPLDTGKNPGMGTGPRTYDEPTDIGLYAGDMLCMTMQGYTGYYGDDLEAFNREWDVEWAVMEGSVASVEVTDKASPYKIPRPNTVTLDHGKGPNKKGSLGTDNVLDGHNVYLKISLSDDFEGDRLKMYIRLIRKFEDGDCAAYCHTIFVKVSK